MEAQRKEEEMQTQGKGEGRENIIKRKKENKKRRKTQRRRE